MDRIAATDQPRPTGQIGEGGGEGEGGRTVGGQSYFNGACPSLHQSLHLNLKQLTVLQGTVAHHDCIVELSGSTVGVGTM